MIDMTDCTKVTMSIERYNELIAAEKAVKMIIADSQKNGFLFRYYGFSVSYVYNNRDDAFDLLNARCKDLSDRLDAKILKKKGWFSW